jgi:hypothetical protein
MAGKKQGAMSSAEVVEAVEKIKALIAQHGWTVLSFEKGKAFPQYSYTVGLARKGVPELIMLGLDADTSRAALNRLAQKLIAGDQVANGDRLDQIISVYAVVPRELSSAIAAKHMKFAKLFAQNQPWKALQVYWPDPSGIFPWEADYDKTWLKLQPNLGSLQ